MVLHELRALFSRDVIFSLFRDFSFKQQRTRSLKALYALKPFLQYTYSVLREAPYLFVLQFLVTWMTMQYEILGVDVTEATITLSGFFAIILLMVANSLCYVEVYNMYGTDPITKPGWYSVKHVIQYFLTFTVTTVLIFIGLLMFVIPGVYLSVRLSLSSPACLIDGENVRDSLRKSIAATEGQHTMIATTFVGLSLIVFIFLPIISAVSGNLLSLTILAFMTVVPPLIHVPLALLYLNGKEDSVIDFY